MAEYQRACQAKGYALSRATDRTLIFRTDAGPQIGMGHAMRCLALAQAWQDTGGRAVFAMATTTPALVSRLEADGVDVICMTVDPGSVQDGDKTALLAQELAAAWVVVDGYHFDARFQRRIKDTAARLLVIDDNGQCDYYSADMVLNQNLHAAADFYLNKEPSTRLLLGSSYMLLRREFLIWSGHRRNIPERAGKLLITMGGADPDNNTVKIMEALQTSGMESLEICAVVGSSNPHRALIEEAIGKSRFPTRLCVNHSDMAELLAWADLAVSSGGTTVWEMAFMGLPALVGVTAPVEALLVSGLERLGLFAPLGWLTELSPARLKRALLEQDRETRRRMSKLGQQVIDGDGCKRVLESMEA